ncbi:O-antigen ligase family protein [Clostridium isatidis]|uniref:O-antigen ligase-related domain-containing protein n=1 Tax=Clostridium isatidis TaxID=182773 RepID=A0A343JAT6_9CLOT|nr:O-antigen ligase family protein [Clostridium isatidis]ASW42644.1 hypothetical protein BEN51_03865 [Clostridium isatidis]
MKIFDWLEEKNIYYKMLYIFYAIISVTFLKEIPYLTTVFSLLMVFISFLYFCLFIKNQYYLNISKVRYLLIVFLVFQLSTFFVSTNYVSDFIKLVFNVIYFFIVSVTVNKNTSDTNNIFKFLVWSIFPVVLISLFTYYFKINFEINGNVYGRIEDYDMSTKTLQGITVNINTLGILCVFLIISAFHLIISEKLKVLNKIFIYVIIFVGIITLIHTQARGAFIALIIYTLTMIIFSIKKKSTRIIILLSGILISVISAIKIFSSIDIAKFSTGRTLLWKAAIEVIKRNPLLGVGTTSYIDVVKETSDVALNGIEAGGLHNIYLQIATANGIITLVLFIVFIAVSLIKFIRNIKLNNDDKNYILNKNIFSLIISILVYNLFESALLYIMSFISLIFWVFYGELLKNISSNEER